jgi:hypothetical protein
MLFQVVELGYPDSACEVTFQEVLSLEELS